MNRLMPAPDDYTDFWHRPTPVDMRVPELVLLEYEAIHGRDVELDDIWEDVSR